MMGYWDKIGYDSNWDLAVKLHMRMACFWQLAL